MITVAQKTLFFTFLLIFSVFLYISLAFGRSNIQKNTNFGQSNPRIYESEELKYKIYLNGIRVGKASISYKPNQKKGNYKFLAAIKSSGLLDTFYTIDESFITNGKIINERTLNPLNSNVINRENGHSSDRFMKFLYKNELIKMGNNKFKNRVYYFPRINRAKDILSSLYSLRFLVDVDIMKNNEKIYITSQHLNKTIEQILIIQDPFYKKFRHKKRSVRNITILSKTTYFKALPSKLVDKIKKTKQLPKRKNLKINNKKSDEEFHQNIKITITNDEEKLPVFIEYRDKRGKFRAILQ